MWQHIRLQSLGVIEEAELELGAGFTVITGETGAGKTMVVTALGLLRGERADAAMVRHGSKQARVEARVELGDMPLVSEIVDGVAGETEDGTVLLARVVSAQGRSRAFLGGASVPAGLLSTVSDALVAVHGQSDQYRLLKPSAQRLALDTFAGATVAELLASYGPKYERLLEISRLLDELRTKSQERARELDLLRFGFDEITAVAPSAGEDEAMLAEENRLAHAEGLALAARAAHDRILGDEMEAHGAHHLVADVARQLDDVQGHDAELDAVADRAREVGYLLADLGADLGAYGAKVEMDPERLAIVQGRRAALGGLQRKYGPTLADVLDWAAAAATRVGELGDDDERIGDLEAERQQLLPMALEQSYALTKERTDAASTLATAVNSELRALSMPHARIEVVVDSPATDIGESDLGPTGSDRVELLFAANNGAPPRPLNKGASGGELSRLMLALEVVLVDQHTVPTLVFDEVDAGIGGKAAVEVGRRLARLARHAQVLAVTHLPQVAAFADHHFQVLKDDDGFVTSSTVGELDDDGRIDELSRMLAGLEDSESAQAHARELLELARK